MYTENYIGSMPVSSRETAWFYSCLVEHILALEKRVKELEEKYERSDNEKDARVEPK